jgi:hypothetical protein
MPFILVAALGMPTIGHSQALLIILFGDKLSTEKFQLGINADLTWSGLTGLSGTSSRMSWAFGAYGELKLGKKWRLQPELTLKTPAGAKNMTPGTAGDPFLPIGDPFIDEIIATGTVTRSTNYITIPVYLKYHAGPLWLGAGAQVGFLTSATDELINTVPAGDFNLKASVKDTLQTVDAGLVGSIDFPLKPSLAMRSIKINLKGYYGRTDTVKDNPADAVRNWIVFLGIDIPVGGKKASEGVDDSDE